MSFKQHISAQLRRPTGLFGRHVMTAVLNRRNATLIDAALRHLELTAGDTYCDIGFGGGRSITRAARMVAPGHVWGVDYAPDVVVQGHRKHRAAIRSGRMHVLVGDVTDLPFRDGLFTKISTINTIYFWPEPLVGMRSLLRVTAPSGQLAIGFTAAEKMESYGQLTEGFTKYAVEQVVDLMREAGFEHVIAHPMPGDRGSDAYVAHGRRPA